MSEGSTPPPIGGLTDISPAKRAASAASVSAELLDVGELAQGLSLVAKNARTLVSGAGDRARGLGVIAEHFSELADTIIAHTHSISALAVQLSRVSVLAWRSNNAMQLVRRASDAAAGATYWGSLVGPLAGSVESSEECRQQLRGVVQKINLELSKLHDCMRTSEVISVTFLLEASQTGANEQSLVAMASKIDTISKAIRSKLTISKSVL
ncbi:MAG: hypothetical protein GY811_25525 [Myxococcales bacterium]|nr:hypothetical protein [Myxococcales bacterium]